MNVELMTNMAADNMLELSSNPYPGRGVVVGTSQDGKFVVQIYWIMGRSDNSRNRIFSTEGGRLFTEAADPSKVKDPKLIIYNAMDEFCGSCVVSNGDQTDTVIDALMNDTWADLSEALNERDYEPDEPNFTPRITGLSTLLDNSHYSELSMLRKSRLSADPKSDCEHFVFELASIAPGFGFCITTYMGDGNPLPSFVGEPYPVLIDGGIDEVLQKYWEILNEANRVSLAVKFIEIATGKSEIKVINKYTKVAPVATA